MEEECVCHFQTAKSETYLKLSTSEKVDKLIQFAEIWAQTNKQPEQEVATKLLLNSKDTIIIITVCRKFVSSQLPPKTGVSNQT